MTVEIVELPRQHPNNAHTLLRAEELGADLIFGWDHFDNPRLAVTDQGIAVVAEGQPRVEAFTAASARVDELAAAVGRDGNDIERSVHCLPAGRCHHIHHRDRPDSITGYDFSIVEKVLAWRDRQNY